MREKNSEKQLLETKLEEKRDESNSFLDFSATTLRWHKARIH